MGKNVSYKVGPDVIYAFKGSKENKWVLLYKQDDII